MSELSTAAVIIKNLKLLDEGASYAEYQIARKIFGKIDEVGIDWNKRYKWLGKFNWWSNDGWWMAPPNWTADGKSLNLAGAYFMFDVAPDDDEGESENCAYLYLTRLCGVRNPFRLTFKPWLSNLKIRKSDWKRYLVDQAAPFQKRGFKIDSKEGHLYCPFQIEPDSLIKALDAGTLDDVLEPFNATLEIIAELKSTFDTLIGDAKKELAIKNV